MTALALYLKADFFKDTYGFALLNARKFGNA